MTLVPKSFVDEVRDISLTVCDQRIWTANGTEIEIAGQANIPFKLAGRDLLTDALVSPDVEEVMLGMDWLKSHKCLWDFDSSRLYIDGRPAVALSRKKTFRCRRIYVESETVLPPGKETDAAVRSTLLSPSLAGPECIVETQQVRPDLYIGRTLLPSSHRDLKVRLLNTTNQPITVVKNACVGNLSAVTALESHANKNIRTPAALPSPHSESKDTAEIVTGLLRRLPDKLSLDERDEVCGLLKTDIRSLPKEYCLVFVLGARSETRREVGRTLEGYFEHQPRIPRRQKAKTKGKLLQQMEKKRDLLWRAGKRRRVPLSPEAGQRKVKK